MKLILSAIAALVTFSQASHAYFLAVPPGQTEINYGQISRILLSGRGTDLGEQPQESAMGSALLYKMNFPNDQVVLLSVFENERNEAKLVNAGWTIVIKNDVRLETKVAVAEIQKFQWIQSLEFFGHNSPSLGTQADGLGYRFDFREPVVKNLTPLFMPGSFAWIHGCNSGWIIAPELSRVWGIPVAAAMSETRFEHLHTDGHFYVYTDAKAPNSEWAKTNPDLGGISCEAGGCIRMRPAYSAYNGHWGNFKGPGLSHYKFFCATLPEKECEKRMASALFGFVTDNSLKPTSTFEDFKKVAKDFLCPVYKDRKITNECLQQLDKVEKGQGNRHAHYVVNAEQLVCTFGGCLAKMVCSDSSCKVSGQISKNSTTIADEYLHFLNGFRSLQAEGL